MHACNSLWRAVRGGRFCRFFAVTCIWGQSYNIITNAPNKFGKKLVKKSFMKKAAFVDRKIS